MDGAAIAIATDDTFQVIAAEGENSAAQALRNASEVNFDFFCHNQTAGGFCLGQDSHLHPHLPSQSLKSVATGHLWQPSSYAAALSAGTIQTINKLASSKPEMQKAADPADISVLFFSSWC